MSGHFWYLLVLKRSFLGLPATWNEVRESQFCVEDGENHQNSGLPICTSPLMLTIGSGSSENEFIKVFNLQ